MIRVELADRLLELEIRDDGEGFDMNKAREKASLSGSLGLISMEERAELARGRLRIRTTLGAGTTVEATFTLDIPDHAALENSDDQQFLEAQ